MNDRTILFNRSLVVGIVAAFAFAANLEAAPIGLTLTNPDVGSGSVNVTYDASADLLQASGFASTFTDAASLTSAIAIGSFDLSAQVDSSGVASNGALSIGGTINSLGYNSGTLLTGTLSSGQFGFNSAGGYTTFEFIFNVTGGDLAPLYTTGFAGTILSLVTGFSDFNADFNNNNNIIAVSDTASVVPIPAAVWLFGSGIVALASIARRRKT